MSPTPPLKKEVPIRGPGQAKIIKACERHWNAHQSNCSGFVNAVADQLAVPLPHMKANPMVDHISSWSAPMWWQINTSKQAGAYADEGYFVLACLKSTPNGHVAIVTSGHEPDHGIYPRGYWGTLNSIGEKNGTMNYSFKKSHVHMVSYFRYMHKI